MGSVLILSETIEVLLLLLTLLALLGTLSGGLPGYRACRLASAKAVAAVIPVTVTPHPWEVLLSVEYIENSE